jgi:hypothetical protein
LPPGSVGDRPNVLKRKLQIVRHEYARRRVELLHRTLKALPTVVAAQFWVRRLAKHSDSRPELSGKILGEILLVLVELFLGVLGAFLCERRGVLSIRHALSVPACVVSTPIEAIFAE